MQWRKYWCLVTVSFSVLLACNPADRGWNISHSEGQAKQTSLTMQSPAFLLDALYPSMRGPADNHYFRLDAASSDEILWITDFEVTMNGPGTQEQATGFMCHTNFDYDISKYYERWGLADRAAVQNSRLMTLSQGQTRVSFPAGYALPVMADDNLSVNAQVLNHDSAAIGQKVRQSLQLTYRPGSSFATRPKPLFQQSIMVLPPVSGKLVDTQGASCAKIPAVLAQTSEKDGTVFTGHWMAPVGRDTVTSDVTSLLHLPFETTLHYAGVHVHPFAETLELHDATTGETVFVASVKTQQSPPALIHIDHLESVAGIVLSPGHQYYLTCITNNPTAEAVDMMAVMLLYLYDRELDEKIQADSGQ